MLNAVMSDRRAGETAARALRQMCLAAAIAAIAVGCTGGSKAVLNQQAEAHRLASHLRVEFTRAADASNLAVMADTDEASSAAAREAQQATQSVERDVDALKKVLDDLGDRQEAGLLDKFTARFDEYRKLDETILPLAVENTNIKAQRLAFGPGQQAVDEFQRAIDAAARPGIANNARVAALAAQAVAALLEVQVLQARHIAESSEAEMSRMETSMKAAASRARQAIESLKPLVPPSAAPQLAAAAGALERFTKTNDEIVALSRRNSNVRSLALSLGKKRTVTAECNDILQALEDALASHHFSATR